MRFVSYQDRKKITASLRTIYTAPTVEAAELGLKDLDTEWGRHPGDGATRSPPLDCGFASSVLRKQRPRAASPVASSRCRGTAGGGPASATAYRSRPRCAASASRTGGGSRWSWR